jgi:hypothetical protein
MRHLARVTVAGILAWMLAGCAIIIDDDWGDEGLRGAIRDTSAELNLHYARMDGAIDVPTARLEIQRHAVAMETHDRHLRGHVETLTCDGDGERMMAGLMVGVERRVGDYLAEVDGLTTLSALRAAGAAYAADMEVLFDRLRARSSTMGCWEDD